MPRTADHTIRTLSRRQHGVFTRRQALNAGFTARMIEMHIASGHWVTLKRGTYGIAGAPDTWERRAMAEVLSAGVGAALSHLAAAWLWKLIDRRPERIDVTVPRGRRANGAHRARGLARGDIRPVNGIPTTGPGRTLVDLAGCVNECVLAAALDAALLRGMVSVAGLGRYIDVRGLRNLPGVGVLRRLLAERESGVPESELEREFLRLVRRHGLPMPLRQERVGPFRVDFIYPDQHLVVEVDGRRDHSSKRAFEEDRRRQNEIVLAGYRPLRFTWDAITKRADDVVRQLRGALGDQVPAVGLEPTRASRPNGV